MSEADKIKFMSSSRETQRIFGEVAKATDFVLPHPHTSDCSETQTWWFNFFIPELNLDAEIYFWIHSNLNTASGGVWIFQGIKQHHLQSEHFNFKNHMRFPEVTENTLHLPEVDLTIRIIEPLKRHEVLYKHEDGTELQLFAEALIPPVIRANNAHFEQPMHMTGTLKLQGTEHKIDCMAQRDRSWGEPRPELTVLHPPTSWGEGVSEDGLTAFNFNGTDDPDRNPTVASYGIPKEQLFKDGWVYRDGTLRKVVAMSNLTKRGTNGIQALSYDCVLTDTEDRKYHLTGEVLAGVTWSPWPNITTAFGNHVRWVMDGKIVLRGEAQECFWADGIKRMLR